jgi:putative spermidine/putrescine transport system permease protein
VFLTVTVPAVAPGVITGALLTFIISFNEFVVSLFLVDKRTETLPVAIYTSIRSIVTPDIAAVSVVYIVLAAAAIALVDRFVGLDIFLRSR